MGFDHVLGQATATATLKRALASNLVHHAYRFEGLAGVGKETTARAFAQALLCSERPPGGSTRSPGCERCDACRRAVTPAEEGSRLVLHPDVVFVARGLYPKAVIGKDEKKEISIEQIRKVILSRAAYSPHEGRAQIFIVCNAEQLSISAANALLKVLEEPQPHTHFVLLTAQPERLLDTIRSRTLPVRFAPLSDEVLRKLLLQQGIAAERIASLIQLAGGSAAAALALADNDVSTRREEFVARLLGAVTAPDMGQAVAFSEKVGSDRTQLINDLRAVGTAFVREAHAHVASDVYRAELAARRHQLVLDAIGAVERNGAAGLCVTSLVSSLRHAYQCRPGKPPPIVVTRR